LYIFVFSFYFYFLHLFLKKTPKITQCKIFALFFGVRKTLYTTPIVFQNTAQCFFETSIFILQSVFCRCNCWCTPECKCKKKYTALQCLQNFRKERENEQKVQKFVVDLRMTTKLLNESFLL
jgi:hypothetical protein